MKHVLVVIDMQNDFVGGPLGSKSAKAIVPAVVDAINDPLYDAIVVTQDTHDDTYMETLEGKKLPVPHCISTVEEFSKNFDSETSG